MYPGLPILPEMETGASDSIYTLAAGIPPGNPMRRTSMPLPTNRGKAV